MRIGEILNNLLGLPQGGASLADSYGMIKDRKARESDEEAFGGYIMPNMIHTRFGGTNDTAILNEWAMKSLGEGKSGQVLGSQQPLATQYEQPMAELPYSENVLAVPQIKGKEPIKDVMPDEETIKRYVKNAKRWARNRTTNPKESNLTYRYKVSDETLKENAEFVGKYIESVMRLAPYFNLPPKTVASMIMQESGWGGQRFEGNLGGYGFPGKGDVDQGYRFDAPTVEEMAAKYLEQLSKYRYEGSRSPEDFHKRGYNTNKEYPGKIYGVMNMLEAK